MPIFEYRCTECGKRFSLLIGVVAEQTEIACTKCGSTNVSKIISRFSTARSQEDLFDNLSEPSDPDDPHAVRDWMKKVGDEMGEDLGGEFDQYMSEEGGEPSEEA